MALKLAQENVSLHKVHTISDSMSTPQQIQNLHPSQQVANSDENEILSALAAPTERKYHLIFTWCPSHSGVHGNELADTTTVEQEGESHHYDSAKAAIWQVTKEPTSVYVASMAKEARKCTTSWKACSCQGRTKSPSAD